MGREGNAGRKRFAQLALGQNSKAVHRAYTRKAQVTLPPLEDYEKAATASPVILLLISTTAKHAFPLLDL